VILGDANNAAKQEEIDSSQVTMGNGGVNYGDDGILFCAQGSFHVPSGLYEMKASSPYSTRAVITSFHGRPFNSVNDVVIHSDGTIWFTDPTYGFEQGFRPRPQLPSQVYRYDPKTEGIRAMADGFGHPNGICFSPDEKTVYVTDTDRVHGGGGVDDSKASTM
jgi:gluconolactonase